MKALAAAGLAAFLALNTAQAAPLVGAWDTTVGPQPVTTDLFDLASGASIASASPTFAGFGADNAISGGNATETIFTDGAAAGSTSQITFNLPGPTLIGGYRLFAYDDSFQPGNANRGISSFRLFGSSDGTTFSLLSSGTVDGHPYVPNLAAVGQGLLVSDSFAGIELLAVRLEVSRFNNTGPRVVELDGLAPVPLPAALWCLLGGVATLGATRTRRAGA